MSDVPRDGSSFMIPPAPERDPAVEVGVVPVGVGVVLEGPADSDGELGKHALFLKGEVFDLEADTAGHDDELVYVYLV